MAIWVFAAAVVLICVLGAAVTEVSARRRLRERALRGFGKTPDYDYEVGAAAAYASCREAKEAPSLWVDRSTWDDLDMDLVYKRINRCQSSVGEACLYSLLHDLAPAASQEREALVSHYRQNPGERERAQILLAGLGKKNSAGLTELFSGPEPVSLPLSAFYPVLSLLPMASLLLFFLSVPAGILGTALAVILNLCLFYMGKRRIEGDLELLRYFYSLLGLCGRLSSPKKCGFAPVRERLEQSIKPFRSLCGPLSGLFQRGSSDLELIQEYLHILTLQDLRVYRKSLRMISGHLREFRALYDTAGEIDAAISILSFRNSLTQWCVPVYHPENSVSFEALCHPLLSTPVPNSGVFSRDVLLTGSNASGKSTFLKALAVNAILGQSINTCAAVGFSLRRGLVISSMAVRDDITEGESYFMAEVRSLKRLTDAPRVFPCLCFIDEILKGTNTVERLCASQAVLEELHRRDCLCIAASHDLELSSKLGSSFENYHFRETLNASGIRFDYRLRSGPSNTKNAIELLSVLGFGEGIVRRARELAAMRDAEALADKPPKKGMIPS